MTLRMDESLEHRLTKLEMAAAAVLAVTAETQALIKAQNGMIRTHMANDETWMTSHANLHIVTQARADGFRAGLLLTIAILTTLGTVGGALLARALFG